MPGRDLSERVEDTIVASEDIRNLAKGTQKVVGSVLSPERKTIKTILNGTWLEHPLHPVLTDLPIGFWTMNILLDILGLATGKKRYGRASAVANGVGILGALSAAVTGFADWMDVDPPELSIGIVHAMTNILGTVFFLISFMIRSGDGWRVRKRSFVPALLGYLTVTVGAFLGGSLVFRRGVMVNRNAYRSGPKDFVPLMPLAELPENKLHRADAQGQPVVLLRTGDSIYAMGAVCSHYGGPLDEGQVVNGSIECPWHGSRFCLADASVDAGPATAPQPLYEARVRDGQVELRQKQTGG